MMKGMTMTRMTPLLDRNERFADTYSAAALGLPATGLCVVTCLDHRVDPAIVLGLELGDATVIRNMGGRVTESVLDDLAFLTYLVDHLSGGQSTAEVAIIHHTQCGTSLLADPGFRHQAAESTGLAEPTLTAAMVTDPFTTVRTDVARVQSTLAEKVLVSGHVYDIATGRVTTIVDT